jgi:hypothetical protein
MAEGAAAKLDKKSIIMAIAAGFLLVLANTAVWVNRYVFDTNTFTSLAVSTVTEESSRQAVAAELVDRALADRPVLKNVAGDTAANFISGLLSSPTAEKALTRVVTRLQIVLTSPQREAIVINLEGLKQIIARLVSAASSIQGEQRIENVDPERLPNQITLLDPKNLPNFYQAGITLSWLSPLAFIAAIILLALPYLWDKRRYARLLLLQGAVLIVAGLLALLLGPLIKPTVLANVTSSNMRVVVDNLYTAFINTFNEQTILLIIIGIAMCIASLVPRLYGSFQRRQKA